MKFDGGAGRGCSDGGQGARRAARRSSQSSWRHRLDQHSPIPPLGQYGSLEWRRLVAGACNRRPTGTDWVREGRRSFGDSATSVATWGLPKGLHACTSWTKIAYRRKGLCRSPLPRRFCFNRVHHIIVNVTRVRDRTQTGTRLSFSQSLFYTAFKRQLIEDSCLRHVLTGCKATFEFFLGERRRKQSIS